MPIPSSSKTAASPSGSVGSLAANMLCDDDRRKIEAKLGPAATPADVDLATNIVALFVEEADTAAVKHSESIDGVTGVVSVRWKLIARVPSTLVNALLALSSRIVSIELDIAGRQLSVATAVGGGGGGAVVASTRRRKRRRVEFDFDSLHIDDADDRRALESLVDDVYALSPLMPSLSIGVEPLVDRRATAAAAADAADDTTENEVGTVPVPNSAPV